MRLAKAALIPTDLSVRRKVKGYIRAHLHPHQLFVLVKDHGQIWVGRVVVTVAGEFGIVVAQLVDGLPPIACGLYFVCQRLVGQVPCQRLQKSFSIFRGLF